MDSLVYYNRLLLKNYCPASEDIRRKCLGFLQQLEQIDSPRKLRYQEIGECLSRAEIHTDRGEQLNKSETNEFPNHV